MRSGSGSIVNGGKTEEQDLSSVEHSDIGDLLSSLGQHSDTRVEPTKCDSSVCGPRLPTLRVYSTPQYSTDIDNGRVRKDIQLGTFPVK